MTDEIVEAEVRQLGLVLRDDLPAQYGGDRRTVFSIAKRMLAKAPKARNIDDQINLVDCVIGAQMAMSEGLDPLTDIYLWKKDGQLFIQRHYTVLVRWANWVEPYRERAVKMTAQELEEENKKAGDIGYRVYLLRKSAEELFKLILTSMIQGGVEPQQALELAWQNAATMATGIVEWKECHYASDGKYSKRGDLQPSPKGWTWDEVAIKRGLSSAIKRSYGTPGYDQISQHGNWEVDGTLVSPEDVAEFQKGLPEGLEPDEQEKYLKLTAEARENAEAREERRADMTPQEIEAEKEDRELLMRGEPDRAIGDEMNPTEVFATKPFKAQGIEAATMLLETTVPEPPPWYMEEEEPASGEITVGDLKKKLVENGYDTEKIQLDAIKAVFGEPRKFDSLNQVERWNMIQYAIRRRVLAQTKDKDGNPVPVKDRLERVPEIVEATDGKPETLQAAVEFIRKVANVLSYNDTRMKTL